MKSTSQPLATGREVAVCGTRAMSAFAPVEDPHRYWASRNGVHISTTSKDCEVRSFELATNFGSIQVRPSSSYPKLGSTSPRRWYMLPGMPHTGTNRYPALHNAMWPGLVGKGPDSEPPIDLETMLCLTAAAAVDGMRFDGVDLFLALPHTDIDSSDDDLARLADNLASKGLRAGSLVAPVWPATGGGSAMGGEADRSRFLAQVKKACRIGRTLRDLKARDYGVIRIDSASSVEAWARDPAENTRLIARTFREACRIAEDAGERLAAEGEICWGGMHSWRHNVELLEMVDRPQTLGFQADMAHTMLFTMGYNSPEDRLLPEDFDWAGTEFAAAYRKAADALRPWTIDFHVAQNDGTVRGTGSHDKTGRHCPPCDPNGKLDIVRDSGAWLRGPDGAPARAFRHICWDGCMFPNEQMLDPKTWNDVLRVMLAVRDAHGWN